MRQEKKKTKTMNPQTKYGTEIDTFLDNEYSERKKISAPRICFEDSELFMSCHFCLNIH